MTDAQFDAWLRGYHANLPEWCRQVRAATLAETREQQADRIRYGAAVAAALDGAREEHWHEHLRSAADISPGAMGGLVITAELTRPHPRPFAHVAQATRQAGQPLATVNRHHDAGPGNLHRLALRRTIADDVRFARDTVDRLDAARGYLRR